MRERKNNEIKLLDLKNKKLSVQKWNFSWRAETNSDNLGNREGKKSIESLESIIKYIRTLTIKIPTNPEGLGYFFFSLPKKTFTFKYIAEKYKSDISSKFVKGNECSYIP